MKTRVVFISLAVMLAVSMGLIGCGGEAVPELTQCNLTISSTEGGSVTMPGEGTFTYDEGDSRKAPEPTRRARIAASHSEGAGG